MKEELVRRNEEFKLRIAGNSNPDGSKIKLQMAYPTSTLDSMIGALQCLKAMDAKVRAIHTEFSDHELTAVMTIESKVTKEISLKNIFQMSLCHAFYN